MLDFASHDRNVPSAQLLSKRKLLKLVKGGRVRGWDDPRMPTIKGLRRRGYTAEILNKFCEDIGVTRYGAGRGSPSAYVRTMWA